MNPTQCIKAHHTTCVLDGHERLHLGFWNGIYIDTRYWYTVTSLVFLQMIPILTLSIYLYKVRDPACTLRVTLCQRMSRYQTYLSHQWIYFVSIGYFFLQLTCWNVNSSQQRAAPIWQGTVASPTLMYVNKRWYKSLFRLYWICVFSKHRSTL